MKEEYFWSVCLEENSVQAGIWIIEELPAGKTAKVLCFSNSGTWQDDETLISSADTCLSFCIQNLPEGAPEPTKTVFGVPAFWVADGQIERKYLDKIRLLCNKLSLAPTGFVVMPEAIAHFEKSQEKSPISAILIGVYEQSLDISLFRLGNLAGTVNVARSTNITEDVTEGIARFPNTEPLPSRFLLYDSKAHDMEDTKQELIKADWDVYKNVKFLHTPQVEILTNEKKMMAVSLAGAAEIGQISGISFESQEEEKKDGSEAEVVPGLDGLVDPATLGFTSSPDFIVPSQTGTQHKSVVQNIEGNKITGRFDFRNIKQKILKENMIFIAVISIFFIAVCGFCAFWFLPKAKVTIFVSPQQIGGKENVKFDTNASSIDVAKLTIPAKSVSTTVSGSKTKTTTGTKTIGTSAKGSVTFYNVGGSTTIPAGTILTASSLQFSLDNDVQVASASGAASAATATGSITAGGVGADYNLASGTFFTVGDFSSSLLQAKNDSDLSGGTSQEVTAVSSDDIKSLTSDLTDQLTGEGKTNLNSNLSGDSVIIDSSISSSVSSQNFDHQVGDQATTLNLTMNSKVSALSVSRKDLYDFARQVFASEVLNGYTMTDNQIDFTFDPKDINFIINLVPNVNISEVTGAIAGKSEDAARVVISKEISGFNDFQIAYSPNIKFLNFLPHVPSHISITILPK